MKNEKEDKADEHKQENEKVGKLAGIGAGALAGAKVGTVLIPIPVVGTFTGALVGGVLGSEVGKKVGGTLLNKFGGKENAPAGSNDKKDITAELERLAKLREQGVLDDEEFKAAKASLLNL